MPLLQDLPIEVLRNIKVSQQGFASLVRASWFFYDTFLPRLYETFDWGDADREDDEPRADHELSDPFKFTKTIAEIPSLAYHVVSVRLTDWNFDEDEVDRVTINQSNALVQLSGGRDNGSAVRRVKTLVQDDAIRYLLANLPNLTDLNLYYPALGETMFDVAFPKLQRVNVAPQPTDWDNGYSHIDIATVAHFLTLPTLTSFYANALSFENPMSFMALPRSSSSLVELDMFGENIPLQYLKHFLRLPKALRAFTWTREHSQEHRAENLWIWNSSIPAASAAEIQDVLISVKGCIEKLDLCIMRPHDSTNHDLSVLSFTEFTNFKVLKIAPELMLYEKQCTRRTTTSGDTADDQWSWLADGLPPPLQRLVLYTWKVHPRDLKFWPRQLTQIVNIRPRLPSLKSITITPSYAEVDYYKCTHDHSLNHNMIFSNAEDACAVNGIKLTGPWQNYTPWLDKQLSLGVPAKQLTGTYYPDKAAMEGGDWHTEQLMLETVSDVLHYLAGSPRLTNKDDVIVSLIGIIRGVHGFF